MTTARARLLIALGLGIAAATLLGVPAAHAYPGDPPGANCETVPLGALYCDGPVQPNGGWTRCVETPIFQCYHHDPAAPPVKIGEPDHHIGDGL
ncbi:MAG: hypothetical protein QOJ56_4987 [Mycobacterium sp.]|jgi:hypothetical protein|nr:hypothetical protein [Mycobacterium sp.]MDT5322516.1 hypothetical protein [Mycobacterium sp.]MDT5356455.1 hypothetical protein [Mycobacterium sp.]MDT7721126.1 hypothetical protein [Mycobacterium sp.]